jgi:hypothetical protein
MLEILVHLPFRNGTIPDIYSLLQVEAPEQCALKTLNPLSRAAWKKRPEYTQRLGDVWLVSKETPLARVPSAVLPRTWNVLLNPDHPDANQVKIVELIRERFDNRLFRFGAR